MPDLAAATTALSRMALTLKYATALASIAAVSGDYQAALRQMVAQVQAGTLGASAMAAQHAGLIRQFGPDAYLAGLEAGGVNADEADEEDQAAMDNWVAGQLPYVAAFAESVAAAKTETEQAGIEGRIGLWTRSLEACGNLGKASAEKNAMGTWKMALSVEDHCDSCMNLHNVRHRLKWFTQNGFIPREPGSKTLDCHGFKCGCKIVSDSGKQLL